MKEYGGYLEWEHYYGKEYHSGYKIDSVRSALNILIKVKGYKHIYLPYYLCACFKELLEDIKVKYSYYYIDKYFKPILVDEIEKNSCIFLVNYFNQLDKKYIISLSKKYNILLDNTQAFFEKPIEGIDMVNSCRKYFGVSDGSYFYINDIDLSVEYNKMVYDISYFKLLHNLGRYEEGANKFFDKFKENEQIPRGRQCKKMSKLISNILRSIDYEQVIKRRTDNYISLDASLKRYNLLKAKNNAGLFMYPLLINNGDYLKKKLIKNNIYVPTLWNEVKQLVNKNTFEYRLVNDLVLLPIDQRYTVSDMKEIAKMVESFIKEMSNCDNKC